MLLIVSFHHLYSCPDHKRWLSLSAMWTRSQKSLWAHRRWRPGTEKWSVSRAYWLNPGTESILQRYCLLSSQFWTWKLLRVCSFIAGGIWWIYEFYLNIVSYVSCKTAWILSQFWYLRLFLYGLISERTSKVFFTFAPCFMSFVSKKQLRH